MDHENCFLGLGLVAWFCLAFSTPPRFTSPVFYFFLTLVVFKYFYVWTGLEYPAIVEFAPFQKAAKKKNKKKDAKAGTIDDG